jgi:hypothetical protein
MKLMSTAVPFTLRVRLGQYEVEISGARDDVLKTVEDLPNLVTVVSEAFAQAGVNVRAADAQPSQDSASTPSPSLSGMYPSIQGSGNCSDAVLKLLETEWGRSSPRTLPELVEAMRVNAVHFPVTTLSGVLNWLVRKGRVKRWKTDKGYVYVLAGPNVVHGQVPAQTEVAGDQ